MKMALIKIEWLIVALMLIAPLSVTSGARILALLTTPSPSHHIWNRSLMLALAARGHHVTVLSPDPEKQPVPNHTDIVIEGAYQVAQEQYSYESLSDHSHREALLSMFAWGLHMCQHGIESRGAQTLLKSKEKYDLIIVEASMGECFLGFVNKFGYPPVLAITAFSIPSWANYILANPDNPSYIPHFTLPLTHHMGFMERLGNLAMTAYTKYYRQVHQMAFMERIARKHFGDDLPPLREIERNISLIMVNAHFSMDYPRPMVPAMIPVGGMHIKAPQPLAQDLKKYLDEAKHGVIFFSLGSNVRSDKMGTDKIKAFLDAFKELPQRILWKWESDNLPGQPDNVKLGKWLPQNDILAHPNVRLFITHGGLLSAQEAVYHGVPIVGMPFMCDQRTNIQKAMYQGIGEKLEYSTITKEAILLAVRQVTTTPSYRENVKRLSEQFRDQPQSPLDRAVFWTEYVISHKGGAPHLRSAAVDITWYQYLLLDVIGLLLLALVTGLATVEIIGKTIFYLLFGKKCKTKTK